MTKPNITVNGRPVYESDFWHSADYIVRDTLEQLEIIHNNETIDEDDEYGVDQYTD